MMAPTRSTWTAACLLGLAGCSVAPVAFTPLGGDPVDGGPIDAALPPGDLAWARSTSALAPYRVRFGPGGLVVGGSFNAPTLLGAAPFVPVGDYDMAVAGFNPADGALLYASHFGAVGYEAAFVDTLDPGGAPIVHGITSGAVDIGTGPLAGGGGSDTFIGRYGAGPPAWTHRLATADEDKIIATSPGPGGTVYATGYFVASATIGATTLTGTGGRDAMLWRFNTATGALDLALQLGGAGRNEGGGVAWQGTDTFVTGLFDGTLTAQGRALTSAGGLDAFVAKLDSTGKIGWLVQLGGTGNEVSPGVGVDAAGDVYIAGTFQGQIALGATRLTSAGLDDIYVAKLSRVDGGAVWATSIGSPGSDNLLGVAVDPSGRVLVSGNAAGALNLGGGNAGGLDAFLACYEGAGQLRWKRVIGTGGDDRGWGVTFGADGMAYATVTVAGPVDLGVPLIGPANPAGLVLKIVP
jgi:hypothetical protein